MALNKLYEESKKPRMNKSTDRIAISHLCEVKRNKIIERAARAAFSCTALSFTCLKDMGHIIFIVAYFPALAPSSTEPQVEVCFPTPQLVDIGLGSLPSIFFRAAESVYRHNLKFSKIIPFFYPLANKFYLVGFHKLVANIFLSVDP